MAMDKIDGIPCFLGSLLFRGVYFWQERFEITDRTEQRELINQKRRIT